MLAVMMMDRNWSPVAIFIKRPDPIVEETRPSVLLTYFKMVMVMLCSIWLATMTEPKIMAHTINHTVFSMPLIPFVATRSFTAWLPVSKVVDVLNMMMIPFRRDRLL